VASPDIVRDALVVLMMSGGQQPIAYPQPATYHQPAAYPQQGQMYPAPGQPGTGAGSHSGAGAGAGAGAAAGLCGKSTHAFVECNRI
jgi:hypothetical protein